MSISKLRGDKMKNELWMDKKLKEFKDDVGFLLEKAILNFTEEICEQMEKKKVSRADLAKHLGVSRAFITKMLNGQPNLTIKTMVAIAHALDSEFHIEFQPRTAEASEVPVWTWEDKEIEASKTLRQWRKTMEEPVFGQHYFTTSELPTLKAKKEQEHEALAWRGMRKEPSELIYYQEAI